MRVTEGPAPLRSIAAASLAVLLGGALAGCGSDDPETGTVLDATPGAVDGETVDVRVPSARIGLTVGDPVDEVDGVSAPDGAEIVPVGWVVDRTPAGPMTGPQAFAYEGETDVAVLSDGEPVDLVTLDEAGADAGAYVVLPEGEDVTFEVTYDGLTQTVGADGSRDAGVAELFYEDAAEGVESDCADAWGRSDLELTCEVTSWVLPYVPDQGWVADGEEYVVVAPTLDVNSLVTGRQRDEVAFVSDASTIDGTAPGAPLETGQAGTGSVGGVLVAAVPDADEHSWQADLGFEVAEGERAGEPIALTAEIPVG